MKKPNFLMVGAPKCGTSSYAAYLAEHPEIYMAPEKECHFLSGYFDLCSIGHPWNDYIRWKRIYSFDEYMNRHFFGVGNEEVIGEASTEYLYYYENSIPKIKKFLGNNVKIIIMLRDPRKACFSRYKHSITRGWDPLPFLEAVEAWEARKQQGYIWDFDYVGNFDFAPQVQAYKDNFKDVHVLFLEQYLKNKKETFAETLRFLGVQDDIIPPNFGRVYNDSASNSLPKWVQRLDRSKDAYTDFVQKHPSLNRLGSVLLNQHVLDLYQSAHDRIASQSVETVIPKLSTEEKQWLDDIFAPKIEALESVLGFEVEYWR